jgi:hypothetical protein
MGFERLEVPADLLAPVFLLVNPANIAAGTLGRALLTGLASGLATIGAPEKGTGFRFRVQIATFRIFAPD